MTIHEAKMILQHYYTLTTPSEEEKFLYTEALQFLIEETKNPDYMVDLGAFYYEQRDFDLALKYYELAAESDNLYAISNLGYIWYYGRTGEKNYEKAFYYFDKASKMGDLVAAYKVADMYKNGYFVEQDRAKYKSIIEDLAVKVRHAQYLEDPLPEIYTRLAKIRAEESTVEEALLLYGTARDFLARRIAFHPFFGNLNIMKWMIEDIYRLRPFDERVMDLYDLYYVLKKPAKVHFTYDEKMYEVESVQEEREMPVRFGDAWFRTVDDFFVKAKIGEKRLTEIYGDLTDFEVV